MRRSVPLVLLGVLVAAGLGCVSVASVNDVLAAPMAPETAATVPSATAPRATPPATMTVSPVRVAIVGDSLSAGRSLFLGNGLDDQSWMTYAQGGEVEFVGGWARSGATPDQMAEAVRPIGDVDVLVVLAGTNAVRDGRTVQDEVSSYEHIADVVDADRVLVSAIPPYRDRSEQALTYNRDLRALTRQEGWTWVDPWTDARDGSAWADGFSIDGVHPAGPEQYAVLGNAFRQIILEYAPDRALTSS